jgi:LysR family transcriptional regulator, flagellar master operon regulator
MDTTLARTFLAIVESGSFLHAAERLHVTQTAVSARVKTLEAQLGRTLFVRNKSGATLTSAGEQFVRHATALLQVWERARRQVAVPPGRRALLTIGCEPTLWNPLLVDWMVWMRGAAHELALRCDTAFAAELLERVGNGTLDIAVLYAPPQRPGLRVDLLIEEKLHLVTTAADGRLPSPDDYVYVDWGADFAAQHGLAFPQLGSAGVAASHGPLALQYLLAAGGAGYFRGAVIAEHLAARRLHLVAGAPQFLYPAYAVYSENADADLIVPALAGLHEVAARQAEPWAVPSSRPRPA